MFTFHLYILILTTKAALHFCTNPFLKILPYILSLLEWVISCQVFYCIYCLIKIQLIFVLFRRCCQIYIYSRNNHKIAGGLLIFSVVSNQVLCIAVRIASASVLLFSMAT